MVMICTLTWLTCNVIMNKYISMQEFTNINCICNFLNIKFSPAHDYTLLLSLPFLLDLDVKILTNLVHVHEAVFLSQLQVSWFSTSQSAVFIQFIFVTDPWLHDTAPIWSAIIFIPPACATSLSVFFFTWWVVKFVLVMPISPASWPWTVFVNILLPIFASSSTRVVI